MLGRSYCITESWRMYVCGRAGVSVLVVVFSLKFKLVPKTLKVAG